MSESKRERDNRVRKPVSFNKTKEDDAKMLKFVGRKNFSGYIKKLIMADMKAKELEKTHKTADIQPNVEIKQPQQHYLQPEKQEIQLSAAERLEQMKRQPKKAGNGASQPKNFINPQ